MNSNNFATHYLFGNGRLWTVFWLWGVIGSWILFAIFYVALQQLGITWGLFVVSMVIMGPFTVWLLVSVWQCAQNVNNRMWGDAARFLTFVWALNIGIVGGLLLSQLVLK